MQTLFDVRMPSQYVSACAGDATSIESEQDCGHGHLPRGTCFRFARKWRASCELLGPPETRLVGRLQTLGSESKGLHLSMTPLRVEAMPTQ
jgi:hypothetical protein